MLVDHPGMSIEDLEWDRGLNRADCDYRKTTKFQSFSPDISQENQENTLEADEKKGDIFSLSKARDCTD